MRIDAQIAKLQNCTVRKVKESLTAIERFVWVKAAWAVGTRIQFDQFVHVRPVLAAETSQYILA